MSDRPDRPDRSAGDLVQLCAKRRDSQLWEEFFNRFEPRVHAGVRRALRLAGARYPERYLDDLVQEVYCKLLANGRRHLRRCRGRGERSVGAYLGRVAETVALDHLRAAAAFKRGRRLLLASRVASAASLTERAPDPGETPEERLLSRERWQAFLEGCRLAVGQRQPRRDLLVLRMALFGGWTSREISSRLGPPMSPGCVDSLVHRARKRLKEMGLVIPRRRKSSPG